MITSKQINNQVMIILKKYIRLIVFIRSKLNFRSIKNLFLKLFTYSFSDFMFFFRSSFREGTEWHRLSYSNTQQVEIIEKDIAIPHYDTITVSIIIPAFNQFAYNLQCLDAIIKNTIGVTYEIIIIDDASFDQTRLIEQQVQNISVIHNLQNIGFLKSCNLGVRFAKGKFIFLLNNDTQVRFNWLKPLVDLMDNQLTGMVGCKFVYPDGKLQEAGGIVWNDGTVINYGRGDDPDKPEYNYVKEVDYISGAGILIRKSIWDELGGFDERFAPAYFEDTDLAFSVRQKGYKIFYQPKSTIIHFEGISHGTQGSNNLRNIQISQNAKIFLEKWKDTLHSDHLQSESNVFQAHDRSWKTKKILFIDAAIPQFDQDAGSRLDFLYLHLLVEMGYCVKYIGHNPVKLEPYTSQLQQLGIEVLYSPWYWGKKLNEWIIKNGKFFDFVILNRPYTTQNFIDLIRKHSTAKIIYHGHDLQYIRELTKSFLEKNNKRINKNEKEKAIELELFRKADAIMTVSNKEKLIIESLVPGKAVYTFPIYFYEHFKYPSEIKINDRKDLLFVGGFKHQPNVDGLLWFVEKVFPLIQKKIDQVKLHVVGSNPPSVIRKLNGKYIIVHGYVSDESLESFYADCKVAVIPLRYGAGVKGKTVESISHLIPIVSTDYGIEGLPDIERIITASNSADDFANAVIRYYQNDEELVDLLFAYRKYAEDNFSKTKAKEAISRILQPKHDNN